MNKVLKTAGQIVLATSIVLTPLMVFGAPEFPVITPAETSIEIKEIFKNIADFLLGLAGAIAVLYLIWAGIQYITGGAKGAGAAKDSIVNAIIGIVVIILAWVIVQTIVNNVK